MCSPNLFQYNLEDDLISRYSNFLVNKFEIKKNAIHESVII